MFGASCLPPRCRSQPVGNSLKPEPAHAPTEVSRAVTRRQAKQPTHHPAQQTPTFSPAGATLRVLTRAQSAAPQASPDGATHAQTAADASPSGWSRADRRVTRGLVAAAAAAATPATTASAKRRDAAAGTHGGKPPLPPTASKLVTAHKAARRERAAAPPSMQAPEGRDLPPSPTAASAADAAGPAAGADSDRPVTRQSAQKAATAQASRALPLVLQSALAAAFDEGQGGALRSGVVAQLSRQKTRSRSKSVGPAFPAGPKQLGQQPEASSLKAAVQGTSSSAAAAAQGSSSDSGHDRVVQVASASIRKRDSCAEEMPSVSPTLGRPHVVCSCSSRLFVRVCLYLSGVCMCDSAFLAQAYPLPQPLSTPQGGA